MSARGVKKKKTKQIKVLAARFQFLICTAQMRYRCTETPLMNKINALQL